MIASRIEGPMKFAGTLNRVDMREWKHYWEVRGHSTYIIKNTRGGFHCWLRLETR
jgi:hypothetical protein